MKKTLFLGLALALVLLALGASASAQAPVKRVQGEDSTQAFWEKFKAAVITGDKAAVAVMSRFPIEMPYGIPKVKSAAQVNSHYRDVFYHETNAPKCFSKAKPETDPARPKEFTIACKTAAGDEVIIYSFARGKSGWKFTGLDNINE
ncbi:MAG TPA: hypothetical protein DCK93_16540 [Blastocatellia bacterium]|nr:hypothetical protein [Blastocatellia bacterium]